MGVMFHCCGFFFTILFLSSALLAQTPQQHHQQAEKAMTAGDYQTAVKAIRKFLQKGKRNEQYKQAQLNLAECLLQIGEPFQAGRTYQEFVQQWPGDGREQDVRLKMAKAFEARGDFLRAIAIYKDFLARFPKYSKKRDIRIYLCQLYEEVLGEARTALKEYQTLLDFSPKNDPKAAELQFAIGRVYEVRLQDFLKAREAYSAVVEQYEKHPLAREAQLKLAHLSDQKGVRQYAVAALHYRRYLEKYPDAKNRREIWERLAHLYLDRLKQYQNAADAYAEVLKFRDTPEVRLARLRALEETQDPDRILPAYKEFMEKHAKTPEAKAAGRNLAGLLWQLERKDEALATLNNLIENSQDNIEDLMELARLQTEAGKYDDAVKTYQKIVPLRPSGDLFLRMSDSPLERVAAVRSKQKEANPEAEEFPETPETRLAYQQSETILNKALEQFPNHADIVAKAAWQLSTAVYEPQKKYAQAAEVLAPIFERYPTYQHYSSRNYGAMQLVTNAAAANQLARAEALLRRCRDRHPGNSQIRVALAELAGQHVRVVQEAMKKAAEADEKATEKAKQAAASKALEAGKQSLNQAVLVARAVLKEDDSDSAAARAYGYMADAKGLLGENQEQLISLARLSRFAADSSFRALRGFIDQRRKRVVQPFLKSLTLAEGKLENWSFKRDPENIGEKENWVTEAGEGWQDVKAGKDWGDYDGYGWYWTEFDHSGSPDPYTVTFEGVHDEVWVYVNGTLSAHHSTGGKFSFPFTISSEDEAVKKVTIVMRVLDKGGEGGLTGEVGIFKPISLANDQQFLAGLCAHALGRFDQGFRNYRDFLNSTGNDAFKNLQKKFRPIVESLRTELYLTQRQLEKVEAEPAAKKDPSILLRLANAYENLKDEDKALELYKQAKAAAPSSIRFIRALADAYDRRRLYEEEINELLGLLPKLPAIADPKPIQEQIVYLARDRWRQVEEARKFAHQFNEKKPSPSWESTLGYLYRDYNPRDYNKALGHYQKYMSYHGKSDIDDWLGGYSIWDIYNRLNKYDEAIAYAKTWREKYASHPRALEMIYLIGQTYRNQKKIADASGTFLEVIEKYPDSRAALLCATSAIDAFTADIRDQIVNKWFELNPGASQAAEIYYRLGQRYEPEKGGIPRAIKAYRVVWERFRNKDSENRRAANRLSHLLFSAGRVDEGEKVCREMIQKFGNQSYGEVTNAWYRLLNHYGPRVAFKAEVDTTFSTGTTPGRITDGNTDGRQGHPSYSWLSAVSPREHWVDAALYKPSAVHRVHITWGHADELPTAYKLQYKRGDEYVDIPGNGNWRAAEDVQLEHKFNPVTTDRIRVLQKSGGGSTARPNLMMVAEVHLFELQSPEAVRHYKEFVDEMTRAFENRPEAFKARKHLARFYELRGDYMQANLQVQKMLYNSPRGDAWHWDAIRDFASAKMKSKRHGEAAAILRTLLHLNPAFEDKNRVTEIEKMLGEALTASGSGSLVIDPNAPEAGLLWGNAFALSGEEELAWARYVENQALFKEHQHKLSAEFLRIIVHRHLAAKVIKPAVEICSAFLAKRRADPHVSDSDKVKMQILLGDCFYRDERYEIAREHYTSAANDYRDSPESTEAHFKIVTVFIAQKVYERAMEMLDDLLKSTDQQTVIRGHIMMGILHHSQGEKKLAAEEFKTVLTMSPSPETADEIIFRLGGVFHEQGKYKEAVDTLKLIGAWSGESKRVVEIGGEMRIRVSDMDLNLTRGSLEVPVVVQVIGPEGENRDRENVLLTKSEAGAGLFVGSVLTKLGEPNPGDRILQVSGADVITYFYDPKFAQDFILEGEEKDRKFTMKVVSDGELFASSTEIKDEDEIEIDLERDFLNPSEKGREEFRDETEVKPGNNIYLRVVDLDRDLTPEADKLTVNVIASSGDLVQVELTETEEHSGKFDGKVITGNRPPDAIASDHSEGHTAIYAIDGDNDPQKSWIGLMDGQTPKWIQIDMKEVYPIDKVVWHRGKDVRDREPIRYQVQTSTDNKSWQTIATVPESWNYHDKLLYGPLMVRTMPNYIGDPKDLRAIMDMCELAPRTYGESRVEWINMEEGNPFGPDEYYIAVYWGNLYCPETGAYEFATDSDDASFLVIDGDLVAEFPGNHAHANGWENMGKVFLEKGVHKFTYYFQEWEIVQIARAAWKLPSKSTFEIIPKEYFDPGRYPALAKREKLAARKFKINEQEDGMGASITFPQRKVRFARLLIDEFHSDAPAIAQFEVWNGEKCIVPTPGLKIHSLATNNVLELTPGDEITAQYTDELNAEPGTPVVLRASLNVTFYNASIVAMTRVWEEDDQGNRKEKDLLTKRVNTNDPFMVKITDYDEDTTDGLDTVEFIVRMFKSNSEFKLSAKETEPYSGIFEGEVRTSSEEQPGAVFLEDGDVMELVYIDKENTDPGNATERTWKVEENLPTLAKICVVPFGPELKGEEKWNASQLRLIALEDGITVEVVDPDQCLHEGSTIRVRLEGSYGQDQAIVECRVAGAAAPGSWGSGNVEVLEQALGHGLFRGHMKTLLGDKDSPDSIVEAAGMGGEDSVQKIRSKRRSKKKKLDEDESLIPVLNVSGQDVITITYVDQQSPDNPLETEVSGTARILSNGEIGFYDDNYEEVVDSVHVGENFFLMVVDFDADSSKERDKVNVTLGTTLGDILKVGLTETLSHSGIFSAAIPLGLSLKANSADGKIEADYGNQITVRYVDERNTDEAKSVERSAEAEVVAGSDGTLTAFSKKYPDEKTAVETEFKIGECYYYLGKEHIQMKQKEIGEQEIAWGREVLNDLLTHFPEAEMTDQAAFMLGNLDNEQGRYDDAIVTYKRVTRDYTESPIAPEAQFALGKAYESKGEMDKACEEYVRLAYKYPDSPLLADAMIRIGLYFFDKKLYPIAVSVFERFIEKFKDHEDVRKVYFKMGLAYILSESFIEGAEHFKDFIDKFPNDQQLRPAAMYWAGDAYLKGRDALHAYQMFKRCTWDYPESKWAKYARGRLTSPVFDRIAEME